MRVARPPPPPKKKNKQTIKQTQKVSRQNEKSRRNCFSKYSKTYSTFQQELSEDNKVRREATKYE